MDKRHKNKIMICTAILFLCLVFLLLIRNKRAVDLEGAILCAPDRSFVYAKAMDELFPEYDVQVGNGQILSCLENGGIVQAMDVQAEPLLSEELAGYWYPHSVSTVVIAVDREQTDAPISGWKDIALAGEQVAILMDPFDMQRIALAISYGLDKETYTAESAVNLIKGLRKNGLLVTKGFGAPILICYDYQAVSLIKDGFPLEIIVPKEGTLSYVNGLLSNTEMTMPENMDRRLIAAGLRLPDGRCDTKFYPAAVQYLPAVAIHDHTYYSTQSLNSESILRRKALGVRLYTSADGREHQLASSFFIAAVICWAASVVNRAMQKRVQKGAIITAALLIGWMLLRLMKWQLMFEITLGRFLWFTYIPFQILISLTLLWLAWGIDKPEDSAKLPLWLRINAFISVLFIAMVFTNDLHMLVYIYDLSQPGWLDIYTYGVGYYIILAILLLQFLVAIGMLAMRCIRNPRKKGLIFPLMLLILFAVYGYGYINRIQIAYDSDLVMVFAVLSILFFEASIHSGMIPVNTKYSQFFVHSPLSMQIIDDTGSSVLSSISAATLDDRLTAHVLASDNQAVCVDNDTLLFSRKVTGGFTVWLEDISKLNRLHEQIAGSVDKLRRANIVFARDAKIKQEIEEEKARNDLMDGLEAEISDKLSELQSMIARLSYAQNKKQDTAMIAMSLCLIKRRSDFFFSKQEMQSVGASELIVCAEELIGYAALAGTDTQIINELKGSLPAYLADVLYGFFGEVLLHCAKNSFKRILARVYYESGCYTMWLMLPEKNNPYTLGQRLVIDIRNYGGTFDEKDLDDAIGVRLSVPGERGDDDA